MSPAPGEIAEETPDERARRIAMFRVAIGMNPMPLNQRVPEDIVEAACRAWWIAGGNMRPTWETLSQAYPEDHLVCGIRSGMTAALEAVLPTIIDRVKRGFLS